MAADGREIFHAATAAVASQFGTKPLQFLSKKERETLVQSFLTKSLLDAEAELGAALAQCAIRAAHHPMDRFGGQSTIQFLNRHQDALKQYLDLGQFDQRYLRPGENQVALAFEDSLKNGFCYALSQADRAVGERLVGRNSVPPENSLVAMSYWLKDDQWASKNTTPMANAGFGILGDAPWKPIWSQGPELVTVSPLSKDPKEAAALKALPAVVPESVDGRGIPALHPDLATALVGTMQTKRDVPLGERYEVSTVESEQSSGCPVNNVPASIQKTTPASETMTGVEMSTYIAGLAVDQVLLDIARLNKSRSIT